MRLEKPTWSKSNIARLHNQNARSELLIVCEHASNFIPELFDDHGLSDDILSSHVAWDIGARQLAVFLSDILDARLITSEVSRLVYDCNRPPSAHDAIPERSEIFDIAMNQNLSEADKEFRRINFYEPYDALVREESRKSKALVTIHSFTPVYFGRKREMDIGVLHDKDSRLADRILDIGPSKSSFDMRRNEPYAPDDGVTHTLQTYGLELGLSNVMLEIRNDLLFSESQCEEMGRFLAGILSTSLRQLGVYIATKEPAQ